MENPREVTASQRHKLLKDAREIASQVVRDSFGTYARRGDSYPASYKVGSVHSPNLSRFLDGFDIQAHDSSGPYRAISFSSTTLGDSQIHATKEHMNLARALSKAFKRRLRLKVPVKIVTPFPEFK